MTRRAANGVVRRRFHLAVAGWYRPSTTTWHSASCCSTTGRQAASAFSRPSVELMTSDHLTSAQKAVSGLGSGFFDNQGWGFCMSVIARRDTIAGTVGSYGWAGGMGTTWTNDPHEDMVTILMTQQMWRSPSPPNICLDFSTAAYQAIDD